MRRFLILPLLLMLFVAACGDDADTVVDDSGDDGTTRPTVAGDWVLQALTVDGTEIALPADPIAMTIELGEITGNLGCNSFFGSIDAADDGSLAVGPLGQTEMACTETGRMEFEATYGAALSGATAWSADPDGITFSSDTVEIRYEPAPPPVNQPFEATVWHFDTVYSGSGPERAASNQAGMEGVTLVITGDQAQLSGPGCDGVAVTVAYDDGFEGAFAVSGDVTFDTSAACEIVGLAADGLASSTGYMIDENRLTFIGEPGEMVGFSARPE